MARRNWSSRSGAHRRCAATTAAAMAAFGGAGNGASAQNAAAVAPPASTSSARAIRTTSTISRARGQRPSGASRPAASRSTEWGRVSATLCMTPHLEGTATVDEIWFPTKQWAGLTLRTFDLEKRQWSICWVSSATVRLDPPVVGGFASQRGGVLRRRPGRGPPRQGPLHLGEGRQGSRPLGPGFLLRQSHLGDELDRRLQFAQTRRKPARAAGRSVRPPRSDAQRAGANQSDAGAREEQHHRRHVDDRVDDADEVDHHRCLIVARAGKHAGTPPSTVSTSMRMRAQLRPSFTHWMSHDTRAPSARAR